MPNLDLKTGSEQLVFLGCLYWMTTDFQQGWSPPDSSVIFDVFTPSGGEKYALTEVLPMWPAFLGLPQPGFKKQQQLPLSFILLWTLLLMQACKHKLFSENFRDPNTKQNGEKTEHYIVKLDAASIKGI